MKLNSVVIQSSVRFNFGYGSNCQHSVRQVYEVENGEAPSGSDIAVLVRLCFETNHLELLEASETSYLTFAEMQEVYKND